MRQRAWGVAPETKGDLAARSCARAGGGRELMCPYRGERQLAETPLGSRPLRLRHPFGRGRFMSG